MRHYLPQTVLAATALFAAGVATSTAEESPLPNADYGVSRIWPLGGNGGWDYLALEPSGGRLFVTRGDRVEVVETVSGGEPASSPTPTACTASRSRRN